MTYRLHKSGVLTGSLNCYCLACDSFLLSHQHADDHEETSAHQKSVLAIPYSDKFKDEHIRKFQTGYYCEFCNLLLPTASKVNLHVTEDEHVTNKGLCLLLPRGGGVMAFDNVFIEENTWHGLIDGVCSLCNEEFDDVEEHKASMRHSLNLALKEIRFRTDNAIYRQVDDTSLQCLTCNKLLVPGNATAHFDNAQHRDLYNKCRIVTNGVDHETENKVIKQEPLPKAEDTPIQLGAGIKNSNTNETYSAESKSRVLESLPKYQSAGININLERETAYCKKCSKVIKFNCTDIEQHITDHSTNASIDTALQYPSNLDQNLNRVDINDKTAPPSEKSDEVEEKIKALAENSVVEEVESDGDEDSSDEDFEDEKQFAKDTKITFNKSNKDAYCRVCEVHLPANLKSMKEHVVGANHKKLAGTSKTSACNVKIPAKLLKKKTEDFLESGYDVKNIFGTFIIINEEFFISKNSLVLITVNNARLRCIICEVTLPPFSDMEDHIKTRKHTTQFLQIPVIVSKENEFIREVRPGLYHCAYCELVVSGWAELEQHLICSNHMDNRRQGEQRLMVHLPGLQEYKLQKAFEAMALRRLFHMF